ncbi:MBL fold metallo-hydrolase [Patescibacteria group bacterium]|nr:MBL fold metallo-hydrolase [Patescibacteria group bacterium]
MDILWHGQSCFEIRVPLNQNEKKTIVIDPFSPEDIGFKIPSLTADILLITHQHADHNNIKAVKGSPFLIDGPGEYEAGGIFIQGIPASHGSIDKEDLGDITIYTIEAEGVKLCHLSDLNQNELTPEQVEAIGDIDILMIPIGGTYTIDGAGASKIINQIEPKIVMPMHYKLPGLKVNLKDIGNFLKVMGQENIEAQSSFKVKKQGLPAEMKIVVLKP